MRNGHGDLHAVHDGRDDGDDQRHQSDTAEDDGVDANRKRAGSRLWFPLDLVNQVADGDDDLVVDQGRGQIVVVIVGVAAAAIVAVHSAVVRTAAVVVERQPFGRPANDAIGLDGRDVARHAGLVEQHGQVGVPVVTLVDVQTVNRDGAPFRLEVGVHRIGVQGVVRRAVGQRYPNDGVVVVGLEAELQRGHLVRRGPVNGRRDAHHVRVVPHRATSGVLDSVVGHVHQRVVDARKVVAADRQLGAARRYSPERLAAVHGGRGRVHERRVVHVLVQIVVELDAYGARRGSVADARQARHFVLAVRLHRARDVVPHVHPDGVAGVQEPSADRDPRAAGDGTAGRPHVGDDGFDEVEALVGPERERGQQLVHLRPVRHLHRALVQRARVGRRYGARDHRTVHGRGGQQAPAVGHLDHDHLVLGQRPVVADGDPYGGAAGPRPVQRFDGLDPHFRALDEHVLHRHRATGISQLADVALLVRPGARVALRTPLAVVPVRAVVVPQAHLALVAGSHQIFGDARVPGHGEVQVVIALVVERQRGAVDGRVEVND